MRMTEVLTLMAEEVGRAFTLISSGIGVAVKLNYEVMSAFILLTSRIIQLLFLLTHKSVQLFNILANDLFLFFGDIGSGVISVYQMFSRLGSGISKVILALGTSVISCFVLIYESFCSLHEFLYDTLNSSYNLVISIMELIKYLFVLFGSSVLFAVTFVPNLLHLLFTNVFKFVCNSYIKGTLFIEDSATTLKTSIKFFVNSFVNYFTEIPLSSVIGVILGVILFVAVRCLVHFILVNNLYLVPIANLSSFFMSAKQRIFHYLTCFTTRNHLEEQTHEIEEESSTDNIYTDGNMHENRPLSIQFLNNSQNSSILNTPSNQSSFSDTHTVIHSQLARRPIQRKNRAQEVSHVETNCEIKKIYSYCNEENQSTSHHFTLTKDLYKELENEREGKLCIVCQDNPKTVILLPCRHLCLCESCRSAVIVRKNVCPVCRKPIHDSLKVYL